MGHCRFTLRAKIGTINGLALYSYGMLYLADLAEYGEDVPRRSWVLNIERKPAWRAVLAQGSVDLSDFG